MVIDTSVLIAIMRVEIEAQEFVRRIASAGSVSLSAASYVEASIVTAGSADAEVLLRLDALIEGFGIEIEPVTREDAALARDAFLRFGKGRHPAKLNFGDCFSYALAKRLNEPLLFKGDDFQRQTFNPLDEVQPLPRRVPLAGMRSRRRSP